MCRFVFAARKVPSGMSEARRAHMLCGLGTTLVFAQLLALGANTNFLASLAAFGSLICGLVALSLQPAPEIQLMFKRAWLPLSFFAGAMALTAVRYALAGSFPVASADLFGVEVSKLMGLAGAAALGAAIGRRSERLRCFSSYLLGGGALYLLLALWLWREHPDSVWGQEKGRHVHRFTATLMNANAASCVSDVVTLVGVAHVGVRLSGARRTLEDWAIAALAGFAVLLGVFTCLLTASRAGGLALVLALAALLLANSRLRRAGAGLWLAAALGVAALMCAVLLGFDTTFHRPFSELDTGVRATGYRTYVPLILQNPWWGNGLGGFRFVHLQSLTLPGAYEVWDLGAAHQPVLQAALEGGVPFAVLLAGVVLTSGIASFSYLLRRPADPRIIALALGGLIILGVSQIDIALNVPAIACLFTIIWSMIWAWTDAQRHRLKS